MVPIIQELMKLPSPEAMCLELGRYLGLDQPVEPAVLRRAEVDRRFAMHLVMARGNPQLLQLHLDDPENGQYRTARDSSPAPPPERRSTAALLGSAAGALARWGLGGFKRLDDAQVEARLELCRACPHLVDPPDQLAYRVRLIGRSDPRVCDQCGCVASAKVKLPTERCPIGRWEKVQP